MATKPKHNPPKIGASVKPVEKEKAKPRTDAEKAAKFVELATKRATRAIKVIRQLGNLTGSNYIYTKTQAENLITALHTEVAQLETKFQQKAPDKGIEIKL